MLDNPDPKMKETLEECTKDIDEWSYYDCYQSGVYENQDYGKYGPIRVFNCSLEVIYKGPLANGENRYTYWQGDLSQKRLEYLQVLTQKFDCTIKILYEKTGFSSNRLFAIYKKGIDVLVIDPITKKPNADHRHVFETYPNGWICKNCALKLSDIFKEI